MHFQLASNQSFLPESSSVQRCILRSFSSLSIPAHFPSLWQFLPTRSGETASRAPLQSALRRPLPPLQLTPQTTQIHTHSLKPIHSWRPGCFAVRWWSNTIEYWLRWREIFSFLYWEPAYVQQMANYATWTRTCAVVTFLRPRFSISVLKVRVHVLQKGQKG